MQSSIKTTILLLGLLTSHFSHFAQMAKCKGKYFGCTIGSTVPPTFAGLWNQVTPENGTKWGVVEKDKGIYDWTEADVSYNWAKKNGALFKFHTLVWGSQMPEWVKTASTAELTASVENYMKAAAAHFGPMGGLAMIDVLNEPANPVLPDYMKAALTAGYKAEPKNANDLNNPYGWAIWPYQLARKYFPNAVLLTNEYNIEENWQYMRAPYITIINAIKAAPNITDGKKNLIDGLGLQCHGVHQLTATNFKACLDEMWSKTGLPIHITEFDQAANPDEAKQKTVYSTLIPIAWEHPHVAGITIWGYVQGSTWITGNKILGPTGTDSGLQYPSTYAAKPFGDRPALTWLKQYFAAQASLACCPAPAPLATCYPPSVAITAPTTNSVFASTMTIPLTANAADVDGTIANVTYYRGATIIGTATTAPYLYNWKNLPAGTHTITAIATDNSGMKTTSASITITIIAPKTLVYQCSGCTSPTWTTIANWTPAVSFGIFDTAVVRTGEVRVASNITNVTKVETNGIYRITTNLTANDIRLQGGTIKSDDIAAVQSLNANYTIEKQSTFLAATATGTTFRLDGTIKGSALLKKSGLGILQINANASAFNGTWEVSEGKLKNRSYTGLGKCGVIVDSLANLDNEANTSTYSLILKNGGTVNLDGNLSVQIAIFGNINLPAGNYTRANFPSFIGGYGTLSVAQSLVLASAPTSGNITLSASSGTNYNWYNETSLLSSTQTITPEATAAYRVKLTNLDGCAITSAPVYVQKIPLVKGWNLISTLLTPNDSSITALFNGLDVKEIKSNDAYYIKNQADIFNSLQNISVHKGYLVNMNTAGSLALSGTPYNSAIQYNITDGWQIISYPGLTPTAVTAYFSAQNCSIIKDLNGFWIPNNTLNSIQKLESGHAYFIKK